MTGKKFRHATALVLAGWYLMAPPLHMPASNLTRVFDPTGAGDTVAATFTLALVAEATMAEAATLANIAAGLVVRRIGCATTSPDELST